MLKYPTLANCQAAGPVKLRKLFYATGTKQQLEFRIDVLTNAKPLTTDQVVLDTSARLTQCIAAQIRVLNKAIKGYNQEIRRLVRVHEDYNVVRDLPGAGDKTRARVIASLGDDRQRYHSVEDFQSAAGIAPLIIQSGKTTTVAARWATTLFIKQTFHEYAGLSIRKCAWAKAYYEQQLARGKSTQMAKRSLAYKWIRIIYRCWQNRQPYNEAHYVNRLIATHSPLAQKLAG